MRVDLYGLLFETDAVSFYLWSPWRASMMEHRLFEAMRGLPHAEFVPGPDELRVTLREPKVVKQALTAVERILKGWQEEADQGRERRGWRWLLEGDTDDHGYDHTGEPAGLWAFLRLSLDRGNVEDGDKSEDIDLNGFGLRIWPTK